MDEVNRDCLLAVCELSEAVVAQVEVSFARKREGR